MLRVFRRLRIGHIALAIASLLAVTGSLGLHPEPASTPSPCSFDGTTRWHSGAEPNGNTHDCLVCLSHRSLSALRLSIVTLEPGAAVRALLATRTQQPIPAPSRAHAGRAPPRSA